MKDFIISSMQDTEIQNLINQELERQQDTLELIASENIVSLDVLLAQGSILTNKYAEGYPNRRYYGGCEVVDQIEQLAINRAKELFGAQFVNVQPHSGTQANMAVYLSLLNMGDKILGMDLSCGGHLTHGAKVSASGKLYNSFAYTVNPDTFEIDYNQVEQIAKEVQPNLIIAGGSNYPRAIDFSKFRAIADKVGAYLMVDMAHFAGIVAAGLHINPVPYAHVVTSTTHKTLRGPRGGIILSNDKDIAKKINSAVFPGSQGGPLMHVIAAKAIAFQEAASVQYRSYIQQVLNNAKVMADYFQTHKVPVVTGGTDTHLFSLNLSSLNINGHECEQLLDEVNITCNKNAIPFDPLPPKLTSGIRIGTPSITTRGFVAEDAILIASLIIKVINKLRYNNNEQLNDIKDQVFKLCKKYPLT